jgi:hypothetical protein
MIERMLTVRYSALSFQYERRFGPIKLA